MEIRTNNAQLHTQVVLASEYIENILATIESEVVIDAGGRVTTFNRSSELLTELRAGVKQGPVEALPLELTTLLKATVADAERTKPEVALPDGTTTAAGSVTRL